MFRVNQLVGFWAGGPAIVTDGLALHLRADAYAGGQTWADLTANANNFFLGADGSATATDPTFNAGPPPYFSHDGGDYYTLTAAHTGEFIRKIFRQDQPFTLECWLWRGATANTDETIFCNGNPSAGSNAARWRADNASNRQGFYAEGVEQGSSTTQVAVGAWKHLALAGRMNGSVTCTFYLQGVPDGTFTYNFTGWVAGDGDSQSPTNIGTTNAGATDNFQNGTRLAVFRAYARVLTAAEVLQNFTVERGQFGI